MRRQITQSLAFNLLLALLLFAPAGTLAWPQAWVFLILFDVCGLATGWWLMRTDPALLAERMKSPVGGGQRRRDQVVMGVMSLSFAGWLVFMGLDARRFGWSRDPFWAQGLGAMLIVAAFAAWIAVLAANTFAASTIRVQAERGQTVISTGPYALVRHPMYAAAILLFVGAPLLLGSLWGLAWMALFIPLMALRALGEETVLLGGLPGYREYAAKVGFRLLPGVW